ncbi:MAG: hypothetical protein ABI700_09625, partial [Chloroflexota bacterium]
DVWLPRIGRRWRPAVGSVFIPFIAISQILMLFLPVLPAITGYPQAAVGIFLEYDYAQAYNFLDTRTSETDVVLASPLASAWIPAWGGSRVVYGHPYETLNAEAKKKQVLDWYSATSDADCHTLISEYNVRYILYGPEEQKLSPATACLSSLHLVEQIGSVAVYAP